ncbi:MAG: PPK2 family polyphosphate kinase [Thermoplasmatota archaeon]
MAIAHRLEAGRFRLPSGRVHLTRIPTRMAMRSDSAAPWDKLKVDHLRRLRDVQRRLYAHDRYAVLVILQGMDAAGKDSAIDHVFSGVNPQGCQVSSFKPPSPTELAHDFLWRAQTRLPERGHLGIFNRSYYEELLVARVHPDVLAGEGLPAHDRRAKRFWDHRFQSVRDFERHLVRNGTCVVKIFLHLSKAEQRRRFLARLDEPDKYWKFSLADVRERESWKEYRAAYEACLTATHTRKAPWHVVPADHKPTAQLAVSSILLDALEGLPLQYPAPPRARRHEVADIRRHLGAE